MGGMWLSRDPVVPVQGARGKDADSYSALSTCQALYMSRLIYFSHCPGGGGVCHFPSLQARKMPSLMWEGCLPESYGVGGPTGI